MTLFTADGRGDYSVNHRPTWTCFITANRGTSRNHVVAVNWRPGETGEHVVTEALCGAKVDLRKPSEMDNARKVNCTACKERCKSIQRNQFNYASDQDRAMMRKDALVELGRIADQTDQIAHALVEDLGRIKLEIRALRDGRVHYLDPQATVLHPGERDECAHPECVRMMADEPTSPTPLEIVARQIVEAYQRGGRMDHETIANKLARVMG